MTETLQAKNGKNIVVTGVSSGIGHEMALCLAKKGYRVLEVSVKSRIVLRLRPRWETGFTDWSLMCAISKAFRLLRLMYLKLWAMTVLAPLLIMRGLRSLAPLSFWKMTHLSIL